MSPTPGLWRTVVQSSPEPDLSPTGDNRGGARPGDLEPGRLRRCNHRGLLTDAGGHRRLEQVNTAPEHDDAHEDGRPRLDDVPVLQKHEVADVEQPQAEHQ